MAIEYKINTPLCSKDVSEVFKSSGIKRPADDLDRIQKMIDNADVNIYAWDGVRLVGIARAITDFSYCCFDPARIIGRVYCIFLRPVNIRKIIF
ncbi:hypothetical protein SAMN03159341_116109 [Paenibacillus sp. 1_12]|uniref:hypothetical protein n=1 Tax=Paenibacillus sp. 1_12 TaxID=1566278 RepID=UPI0008F2425B|nr:hypothetical protein [Paenibacillus sp. 1_12]SFM10493.1 hypothetical protein SAMN03159341_116109 [Paenibacillus sp. 1_12]